MLLSYVSVIYNGNMNIITWICTKLTWLEEWIFYLEYICGHVTTWWCYFEYKYRLKQECCRKVVRTKLSICIDGRNFWPMYLWHKEDYELQRNKWNEQWGDRQVIMHNNTNVSMPKLADADKQHSLWINYYR